MPIPEGAPVPEGYYKNDETGVVIYACNCVLKPQTQTLRYVQANRDKFTPWPPKQEGAK